MNWAVKILSSHYGCFNLRATSLNLSYLTLNIIINYGGVLAQPNKKGPIKPLIFFARHAKRNFLNIAKGGRGRLLSVLKSVYLKTSQKFRVFAQVVSGLLQDLL